MKKHMTGRQAVWMAGILAVGILLLLIPLWKGLAWSDETYENPEIKMVSEPAIGVVVTGRAITAAAVEPVEKTATGTAIGDFQDPEGMTVSSRILVKEGYKRSPYEDDFVSFLRDYPVYKKKAKVKYYNGTVKEDQSDSAAVLKLPLENINLQQQTSSVQRVFAEFYWSSGQYDMISFLTSSGLQADYSKWREGYQLNTDASSWLSNPGTPDESYEGLQKFLQVIFQKSNSDSLAKECKKVKLAKLQIGDLLIQDGNVVMVVDQCQDQDGQRAYLLAQGGSPAQRFHILTNPAHPDPWYYASEMEGEIKTPNATFTTKSLYRHVHKENTETP
ncbi:MAG: DUF4846 domain-containing protein [Eubacterium sp.]|nr:DUF4846 domain-containing protein [Eubacterium sp.]